MRAVLHDLEGELGLIRRRRDTKDTTIRPELREKTSGNKGNFRVRSERDTGGRVGTRSRLTRRPRGKEGGKMKTLRRPQDGVGPRPLHHRRCFQRRLVRNLGRSDAQMRP